MKVILSESLLSSESRGLTQKGWDALDSKGKEAYLKKHPSSKYAEKQPREKKPTKKQLQSQMSLGEKRKLNKLKKLHQEKTKKVYSSALAAMREQKGDTWYNNFLKALKSKKHPAHHKAVFIKKNLQRLSHNTAHGMLGKDEGAKALMEKGGHSTMKVHGPTGKALVKLLSGSDKFKTRLKKV